MSSPHVKRGVAVTRTILPPAGRWLRQQSKAEIADFYRYWLDGLPEGHVEQFMDYAVRKFLKEYGYTLAWSTEELRKACLSWAFAHVRMTAYAHLDLKRTFMKSANYGTEEHFDWFCFQMDHDKLKALFDSWAEEDFLDDSDAGHAQRADFLLFVWQLIDLDHSRAHQKWLSFMTGADGEEEIYVPVAAPDDTGAFGGDRRTL